MTHLPHSGPIAQAVAGEIARLTNHPDFSLSEGAAYKAAWDRAGSDALKHCEAFRRDCLIASLVAGYPHECVTALIRDHHSHPAALNLARGGVPEQTLTHGVVIR